DAIAAVAEDVDAIAAGVVNGVVGDDGVAGIVDDDTVCLVVAGEAVVGQPIKNVAGQRRVVIVTVDENAGGISKYGAVAHCQPGAPRPTDRIHAVNPTGDLQVVEQYVAGPLQLENVATRIGVAPVEYRARASRRADDADPAVPSAEDDVGNQVVGAG